GYGQWCDAFDFHIYESAENVRRTIGEYRELMKKYDCVKPIWSTELGLNSQGQTRRVVAGELYKKFATFFAAGGTNVSWFGLLYPDPDGKSAGSSGDSHNVFDCRYKRYAPRMDAIAYYNAVNSIAIKKFITEQLYEGGIRAMLFRDRDGQTLQVLWKDKGRQDVGVPLPGLKGSGSGKGNVEVIGIDGTRRVYDAADGAVTLTVSEDPLLVLYQGDAAASDKLPATLSAPQATVEARLSASVLKTVVVSVTLSPAAKSQAKATLQAPPYWTVKPAEEGQKGSSMKWLCTPPAQSAVRIANLTVKLEDENGSATGALGVTVPLE
ncbi:MAG TPA: hypothetical protein VK956_17380, partial [Verrucomicrobium sp.]|nr:hypothetical protein [Verrucomicrobium sp.]